MLIAQIVLAIVVFVYIGDLQEASRQVLSRLWENRNNQGNLQIWDNIQQTVSVVLYYSIRLVASKLKTMIEPSDGDHIKGYKHNFRIR